MQSPDLNSRILLAEAASGDVLEKVFLEILKNSQPATLLKKTLWHRCLPVTGPN